MRIATLITVLTLSLCASASFADVPGQVTPSERHELRQDRREVHRDKREVREDRRDLRHEVRQGDVAGAREARHDLRDDHRELHDDRQERRHDRRAAVR